jgi:hypothetical protein
VSTDASDCAAATRPETVAFEVEVLATDVGGRVVRREGDVVVRPCYPWSGSVHALLLALGEQGFDGAPRFLGRDGDEERLSYLDGAAGPDGWAGAVPEDGLASLALLLRRYHDTARAIDVDAAAGWSCGPDRPGAVVLHGDPGPWNAVWRDGTAVALIDWDHANPGRPREDVGYLAAYAAPLAADDDEAVTWMRHPAPPNRARRLRVIAEAYGTPVDGLVDEAIAVMAKTNRTVERLARLGVEPHRTWAARTKLRRLWQRHHWMLTHRPL